jgi:hypothetical protein
MFEYGKKVMANNSINTTKTNSHLSQQTIEHKIGPQHITMDIK